jgi:hypothetical protein
MRRWEHARPLHRVESFVIHDLGVVDGGETEGPLAPVVLASAKLPRGFIVSTARPRVMAIIRAISVLPFVRLNLQIFGRSVDHLTSTA